MSIAGSPFAYRPGTSLLHRWSSRDGAFLKARLASKTGLWIGGSLALFAYNASATVAEAFVVSALIFGLALAALATAVAPDAAVRVLRDAAALALFGFGLGLPTYLLVATASGIDIGSIAEATLTIGVLMAGVTAALGLAAVFMSTTSLALLLGRVGSHGLWHVWLALVLTYFPRLGERIVTADMAFDSLGHSDERIWRIVVRRVLFIAAEVWHILSVAGPQLALVVTERLREVKRAAKETD
jgi:hypothetical protein